MKPKFHINITFILISFFFIFSGMAFAGMKTIEGKVWGANCVIAKGMCPVNNDPHLALENDFVLSGADGKYYFMPNLSRSHKMGLVAKDVRITGDLNGISLAVSVIEEKKGGTFKEVWNWEKIARSIAIGK